MNFITAAIRLIPLIVGAVQAVESIFKKDPNKPKELQNKERQDTAVTAIGAMIQALELNLQKELLDESAFQALLRKLIDDYIATQNFIRDWQETHK